MRQDSQDVDPNRILLKLGNRGYFAGYSAFEGYSIADLKELGKSKRLSCHHFPGAVPQNRRAPGHAERPMQGPCGVALPMQWLCPDDGFMPGGEPAGNSTAEGINLESLLTKVLYSKFGEIRPSEEGRFSNCRCHWYGS